MTDRAPCGCPPDALSISQIEAHALCARKRAWDKIDRVPRGEDNPSAALGGRTHNTIERAIHYTRDRSKGAPLDLTTKEGKIALSGAHHWPRDWIATEEHFAVTLGGHHFHGFFDLLTPREVWDWKTTGNMVWAKDEFQLRSNPQGCLYAYARMDATGLPDIGLRWLYMKTSAPLGRSLLTATDVDFATIQPTLDWIISQADEIRAIERSGKRALDLAPTVSACSAFGGCAYVAHCNLTQTERLEGIFKMNMTPSNMSQQIAAMAGGAPAPMPHAPTPQPQGPARPHGLPANFTFPRADGLEYYYDPSNPTLAECAGWGLRNPQPPSAPTMPQAPPMTPQGFNPVPDATSLMREPHSAPQGMPPAPTLGPVVTPAKRGRPRKDTNGAAVSGADVERETFVDAWTTVGEGLARLIFG